MLKGTLLERVQVGQEQGCHLQTWEASHLDHLQVGRVQRLDGVISEGLLTNCDQLRGGDVLEAHTIEGVLSDGVHVGHDQDVEGVVMVVLAFSELERFDRRHTGVEVKRAAHDARARA